MLLQLFSTPDRAWLGVLLGTLLLAREFTAPGRVLPGVLGGVALALGGFRLYQFSPEPGGLALLVALIGLLAFTAWCRIPWLGVCGAAALSVPTARYLFDEPNRVSPGVALSGAPVAALLSWLLCAARRAYLNKVE